MNLKVLIKKYAPLIVIIFVIAIVVFIAILLNNKQLPKDMSNTYESNNKYNTDFSIYDIASSEIATYDKYISKEACEQIINQKINTKIKSIEKINKLDKSTATKQEQEYIFLLKDYGGNCWITFSKRNLYDNSYNIQIRNDLICYGKYLGITEYNNIQYPQIDISYVYKNIEGINQKEYISLCDGYMNKLNSMYNKENFLFKEFKLDTGYNELIYANEDESIEISIIVDDMQIKMASLSIHSSNVNLDTIDQVFLHNFISSFNSNITSPDVYLGRCKIKKERIRAKYI